MGKRTKYEYRPLFALKVTAEDVQDAIRHCKDAVEQLHKYEITKDLELVDDMPDLIDGAYRMFLVLDVVVEGTDMVQNQVAVYSRVKEILKNRLGYDIKFCDGTHVDEIEEITCQQ
jgi:hypothetical protein